MQFVSPGEGGAGGETPSLSTTVPDLDANKIGQAISGTEPEASQDGGEDFDLADLAADFIGKINVVDQAEPKREGDVRAAPPAMAGADIHSRGAANDPAPSHANDDGYDVTTDPSVIKHPPLVEGGFRAPHGFSLALKVPDNKVGLLIGKGGRTIRAIARRYRCKIWVPKECDADNKEMRTLTLSARELLVLGEVRSTVLATINRTVGPDGGYRRDHDDGRSSNYRHGSRNHGGDRNRGHQHSHRRHNSRSSSKYSGGGGRNDGGYSQRNAQSMPAHGVVPLQIHPENFENYYTQQTPYYAQQYFYPMSPHTYPSSPTGVATHYPSSPTGIQAFPSSPTGFAQYMAPLSQAAEALTHSQSAAAGFAGVDGLLNHQAKGTDGAASSS